MPKAIVKAITKITLVKPAIPNWIMEKNEAIFTQYKGLYPAFEEVFLERGTLIFPSNLEINLKDIDLSST